MKIAIIAASPRKIGKTQIMMKFVHDHAVKTDHEVSMINLADGGVECYRGYDEEYNETTRRAVEDVMNADVWLIGTPVYNSLFSAALKNLFEYVDYKKTAGKTAGIAILASGQISFGDVQTIVTQLMSYFRVITNPKAVFMTADSIRDGQITDQDIRNKLEELVDGTMDIASRLRQDRHLDRQS